MPHLPSSRACPKALRAKPWRILPGEIRIQYYSLHVHPGLMRVPGNPVRLRLRHLLHRETLATAETGAPSPSSHIVSSTLHSPQGQRQPDDQRLSLRLQDRTRLRPLSPPIQLPTHSSSASNAPHSQRLHREHNSTIPQTRQPPHAQVNRTEQRHHMLSRSSSSNDVQPIWMLVKPV